MTTADPGAVRRIQAELQKFDFFVKCVEDFPAISPQFKMNDIALQSVGVWANHWASREHQGQNLSIFIVLVS